MTVEQLIELGKMGYTKEDIEKLTTNTPVEGTEEGAAEELDEETTKESTVTTKESTVTKKDENNTDTSTVTNSILAELKTLKESIQAMNRNNAQSSADEKNDVTKLLNDFTIDMMGGEITCQ